MIIIIIIIRIIFTHPLFITPARATLTCNGALLWGARTPKKVVEDEFSGHYIPATVGPAFVRYKSKNPDFLNLGPTRVGNIRVRFSDRVKKPKMPKRPFFTFSGHFSGSRRLIFTHPTSRRSYITPLGSDTSVGSVTGTHPRDQKSFRGLQWSLRSFSAEITRG